MWRQTLRWWRLRFKGVFHDNLKWGSVTDLIFFMYLCSVMEEKNRNNGIGHSLFGWLLNKYVFATVVFFVWLAFFDRNNLVEEMQLRRKIVTLKREKEYYRKKIEEDKRKMEELLSSRENLEKFAREQYLMKRANEDIFVIVDK